MFDHLLSAQQKGVRDEAHDFVAATPRQLILDMDEEKIRFPRDWLAAAGVGADLVCDAIIKHGSDAQKERYVKPLLKGEIFAAECLTEPRGGSDYFGAAAPDEIIHG